MKTKYSNELAKAFLEYFGWERNPLGDWKDKIVLSPLPTEQAVEVQRARLNGTENHLNLTKVHTRQLLKWRDHSYITDDACYPLTNTIGIPRSVILVELCNREHVPNKKEGKAARQAAAKRKK